MTNQPFDKPLNQWIEDEVDVPTFEPQVNEAEGRVEFTQTTKKVKRRTMYSDAKPTRIVCSKHEYYCADKGKYLFKCRNAGCQWHRIAPPISFKFDPETGILTHRHTGVRY